LRPGGASYRAELKEAQGSGKSGANARAVLAVGMWQ